MHKVIVIMINNFLRSAILLFLMIQEFSKNVESIQMGYDNEYGGEESILDKIKAYPKLIKNTIINEDLIITTVPPNNTGNYSANLSIV